MRSSFSVLLHPHASSLCTFEGRENAPPPASFPSCILLHPATMNHLNDQDSVLYASVPTSTTAEPPSTISTAPVMKDYLIVILSQTLPELNR
jgi:hypothetical protein